MGGAADAHETPNGAPDKTAVQARLGAQIGPAVFGNVISGGLLFSARAALASKIISDPFEVSTFLTRLASAGALGELLLNPVLGKLSDTYGRRKIIALGNVSTVLTRIVIFMRPTKQWPLVVEQLITVPLTTSFFTVWRAAASDKLDGNAYTAFQAEMSVYAGLGLVAGPLVAKALMKVADVKYCFLASVLFSATCLLHLALKFEETLPPKARKPFTNVARDIQPFSFTQVMAKSPSLNLLMWITGLQTVTEGRNITDLANIYLTGDLGWSWPSVNNFAASYGVALIASGAGAKAMLKALGQRGFTSLANLANFLGQLFWACPFPISATMTPSVAMWVGILMQALGGRKRDAVEGRIMKLGEESGLGAGLLAGALNNWRAVVNIICPLLFGALYKATRKRGRPGDVFLAGAAAIAAAEVCLRALDPEVFVTAGKAGQASPKAAGAGDVEVEMAKLAPSANNGKAA